MGMLDEIGTYLQEQGIGTLASDLYLGRLPDSPDGVAGLFEQQGLPPRHHNGGSQAPFMENPRLQILVRGTDYETARTKAFDIYNKLNALTNTVMGGTCYTAIFAMHQPFPIGYDNNERVRFSCNFQVVKKPS